MPDTTGPTREELLRLAALFRELSKRDSSLRATANTLGERTIYEVVSNDGRRTDQRTFERLAAQTAESLGLAPRGVPIAALTAWLAQLFEPAEALSKVSYVDQATVTRRDGSQGAAELVLREIDNAAEASAGLLELRAAAADAVGDARAPALPVGTTDHDTPTDPTMHELASEVGISDDTFRRVRAAAGIEVKLRGAAARNRRYTPSEVDRLIAAASDGTFLERTSMVKKWARWGSKRAAHKPHARK